MSRPLSGHAFGYGADEPKRVAKSDEAIRARNVAFGFSADELARVVRAAEYDSPNRRGFYPSRRLGVVPVMTALPISCQKPGSCGSRVVV